MGWEIAQRITLPTGSKDTDTSQALAIHGNYLICSKYSGTAAQQQVYIYVKDNEGDYKLIQTLKGSDYGSSAGTHGFGIGVCVYGNDFIVGQYKSDGASRGRVDIFRRGNDGGVKHIQTLRGDTGNDQFGVTVWLSGNYAIVGATGGNYVCIYRKNNDGNYDRVQKITGASVGGTSLGGRAVRINDNYALFMDGSGGGAQGRGYLFKRDNDGTFTIVRTIIFGDAAGVNAGAGLDISDNNIMFGADDIDIGAGAFGSAIFYLRNNKGEVEELKKLSESTNVGVASRVTISGNYAAGRDEGTTPQAVRFYKRGNDGDWTKDGFFTLTGEDNLGELDGMYMDGTYLAITAPNTSTTGQIIVLNRKY